MDKSLLQGSRQEMARSEPHENCEVERRGEDSCEKAAKARPQ